MQSCNMFYAPQQGNLNYLFPPFYFFFTLPEPETESYSVSASMLFKENSSKKKKSLIPYYTDSIVFYKIQGKQHTNKMGFPYSSFDSFIF